MKKIAALALALSLIATPALASDGRVGGTGDEYHVSHPGGGVTAKSFRYGRSGDDTYVGDWDGNGTETLAVRRGNKIYIKNSVNPGNADRVISYGRPGDQLLVGDWNGDGKDTFAVRRGSTYYVKNSISSGNADQVIVYGRPGDDVLVGDWDGDKTDTFAVRRGSTFYVSNTIRSGNADISFRLGRSGQQVLVGNWRGIGGDTFALVDGRNITMYRNIRGTQVHRQITFGNGRDHIFALDWNGDGVTELAVRRLVETKPFFVYGTLRTGQEAHHVVRGEFTRSVTGRVANLDLWITNHPTYRAWPWAIPGSGGLTGQLLYFSPSNLGAMTRKLDLWEGYTPGGDEKKMNYIRRTYRTSSGVDAWVYVASNWRQTFVKNYGRKIASGDITRY